MYVNSIFLKLVLFLSSLSIVLLLDDFLALSEIYFLVYLLYTSKALIYQIM